MRTERLEYLIMYLIFSFNEIINVGGGGFLYSLGKEEKVKR